MAPSPVRVPARTTRSQTRRTETDCATPASVTRVHDSAHRLERRQLAQDDEARVGDRCTAQNQVAQTRQARKMAQAVIGQRLEPARLSAVT